MVFVYQFGSHNFHNDVLVCVRCYWLRNRRRPGHKDAKEFYLCEKFSKEKQVIFLQLLPFMTAGHRWHCNGCKQHIVHYLVQ